VDRSRVSQLPSRGIARQLASTDDRFHFAGNVLPQPRPLFETLLTEPPAAAPRAPGLLLRTASSLFPGAGQVADAFAANAAKGLVRPFRVLSEDTSWAVAAAALGLSLPSPAREGAEPDGASAPVGNTNSDETLDRASLVRGAEKAALIDGIDLTAFDAVNGDGAALAEDVLLGSADNDGLSGSGTVEGSNVTTARAPTGHLVVEAAPSSAAPAGGDSGMQASNGGLRVIEGTGANDIIVGTDASEVIRAGAGDDLITGGKGDDSIDGGEGVDTAAYELSSVEDLQITQSDVPSVDGGSAPALVVAAGQEGTDTLTNVENIQVAGVSYAIVTADGTASNETVGTARADILLGSAANDVLGGNKGDDVLMGADGHDTASFTGGAGGYQVSLTARGNIVVSDQVANRDGSDLLKQVESVRFDGETFTLNVGTSGDDVLSTGLDAQLMIGGEGADVFVFNNTIMAVHRANTIDMVADFVRGLDKLDITWFTSDPFLAGTGEFVWDGSDADGNGSSNRGKGHFGYHVEQDDTDWRTVVDGNSGDGDSGQSFHFALRGRVDLSDGDFVK
jgi:Ca2+-binding RTX toxin-like protein